MMSTDSTTVIVNFGRLEACPSVHAVCAYHRDFPEIRGEGETSEQAIGELLHHLTAALDSVGSERHRRLVQRAIVDVQNALANPPEGLIRTVGESSPRSGSGNES